EVSRNGGEEFTVLLLDCPNSQAIHIAERIRTSVENHPFILSTGFQISITVSIGVASYPETVDDLEKLVEKADTELYSAKRTGRNKVCSQSCIVVDVSKV
ncbi:MAG: diguanylate cyclase protein, partial [Herbinix sp.]|nr:diguanylate cyclase protein [Herbinix sp.]